jgi:hypothetical protein
MYRVSSTSQHNPQLYNRGSRRLHSNVIHPISRG